MAAVTGAASGIGFASAQAMVDAGATVVLVDRDSQALDKACATLGAKALPLVLDLLDPVQCAAMPERILALAGRLDIFHANAGLFGGIFQARQRLDRHPDPAVVQIVGDLKTATGDLDAEGLQKKAWDLGYHQAAEWYGRGYRAVHGVDLAAFWLLFVRKEPPYLVHVVELDADLIARGRAANDEALQVWDECTRTGVWPGPGRDDEPTLIGAPRWAR